MAKQTAGLDDLKAVQSRGKISGKVSKAPKQGNSGVVSKKKPEQRRSAADELRKAFSTIRKR